MFRRALRFHGSGKHAFGTVFYIRSAARGGVRIIYRRRPRKTREYSLALAGFIPRAHCTRGGVWGRFRGTPVRFRELTVRTGSGLRQIEQHTAVLVFPTTPPPQTLCATFTCNMKMFCVFMDDITIVANHWRFRIRVHVTSFFFGFSIIFWKYITKTWIVIVRTNSSVFNATSAYDARYTHRLIKILRRRLTKQQFTVKTNKWKITIIV